jgi:tRNA(Arg) A34 adenosine deaminase TadA
VSARRAWNELGEPWRACLEEAWASWCAGSAGVGAVIVDGSERIIARGRNRRLDARDGVVSLAGTRIAHAEMCALAALPSGPCDAYALFTSFEPCLMCASAVMLVQIPMVHYATPDPLFDGMHAWFGGLPFASERRPDVVCLGGPIGAFAHVLHVSWIAWWFPPDSGVLVSHRAAAPDHLALASGLVEASPLPALAAEHRPVADAIDALWDDLGALA